MDFAAFAQGVPAHAPNPSALIRNKSAGGLAGRVAKKCEF